VVEQWRQGRTLEHYTGRGPSVVSAHARGLTVEERALLRLLRSWRRRSRDA
jgi:hypothetical protein